MAALALLLQTDAGAFIARFLLQNEITYIFDGGPFIRFVNGGPPEIHLSVNPLLTGTDLTAAIALQLVQEGFHATKPYGDVVTLYEEWAMFSIANGVFEEFQAQGIIGNNFQPFKGFGPNDSFNPRDPKLLIGWFNVHHDKYLKMGLPLYPTDTR